MICRIASMAFNMGMQISRTATKGCKDAVSSTAWRPSSASPTT